MVNHKLPEARVERHASLPDLSIIIPTLNESAALPLLIGDLAAQAGVCLEVLVSDGGSTDGTAGLASALLEGYHLPGQVLAGPANRGRQLNSGAATAKGEWLLFLHADSRLAAADALASGLAALRGSGNARCAGRFTLRFDRSDGDCDYGYYLCEVKARIGLPGTIHGDQGFLMSKGFFLESGGFREDLPVLEDTLLAEWVRQHGTWQLLPATIRTSPRRFQAEGFVARQQLNALLANFAMIGWAEPLQRIPAAYRAQGRLRPLQLGTVFQMIDGLFRELPVAARWRIWVRTGAFVRANAWQLALRRLAHRAFVAGLPPDAVPLDPVLRFRYRFDRLTGHGLGNLIAAWLTWLWFRSRRRVPTDGD